MAIKFRRAPPADSCKPWPRCWKPRRGKDHHRRPGCPTRVLGAALPAFPASKAQMFEGLIEFIEQSLFRGDQPDHVGRKRRFEAGRSDPRTAADFAQKNRGMTRVLIGDALVNENERL